MALLDVISFSEWLMIDEPAHLDGQNTWWMGEVLCVVALNLYDARLKVPGKPTANTDKDLKASTLAFCHTLAVLIVPNFLELLVMNHFSHFIHQKYTLYTHTHIHFTLVDLFFLLGNFQHQCVSRFAICHHIPLFRLREATSPHKCPDLTPFTCKEPSRSRSSALGKP